MSSKGGEKVKALSKKQLQEARKKILEVLCPLHIQKTEAEAAEGKITQFLGRMKPPEPKVTKKSNR